MSSRSPAGIYIHVPFCARACPYCDFDFEVGRNPDVDAYLAGLEAEFQARPGLADLGADTLYVGGGTPSLLGADGLRRLLTWARDRFSGLSAVETTVELNPEHADAELIAELVEQGVTRVSLGVQALLPDALRELGRVHDSKQALHAIGRAREAGLTVSADLILGWRGQGVPELDFDLSHLLMDGAQHVSAYALTIEEGTPWPGLVNRGLRVLPDADAQTELLVETRRRLVDRGLEHYEISSYARPGCEAIHNTKYWTWVDYVGLGPSAASATHVDGGVTRRTNPRGLEAWLEARGAAGQTERLDGEAAAAEGLWIGLRRLAGVDLPAFCGAFGVDTDWVAERTQRQRELGNLEWTTPGPESGPPQRLRVAPDRWLFHDSIALDLLSPRR